MKNTCRGYSLRKCGLIYMHACSKACSCYRRQLGRYPQHTHTRAHTFQHHAIFIVCCVMLWCVFCFVTVLSRCPPRRCAALWAVCFNSRS